MFENITTFNFPTRIVFGCGAVRQLPGCLAETGIRKPMIVTDPGAARHASARDGDRGADRSRHSARSVRRSARQSHRRRRDPVRGTIPRGRLRRRHWPGRRQRAGRFQSRGRHGPPRRRHHRTRRFQRRRAAHDRAPGPDHRHPDHVGHRQRSGPFGRGHRAQTGPEDLHLSPAAYAAARHPRSRADRGLAAARSPPPPAWTRSRTAWNPTPARCSIPSATPSPYTAWNW